MWDRELERRLDAFGACPMVAIPTGKLSNLTVVDVDGSADDIDFALEQFGEPEVMSTRVNTPKNDDAELIKEMGAA
jgi:hypothetical protein